MAEKPEVNRSEAIRDYYKVNPTAAAKEVVDALAKEGVTVNTGLVYAVKTKHNQRVAARKTAKKAAKTTATSPIAEATVTAKKNGVNKGKAIRDYLKTNRKATAQEVVDALKKEGIETTVSYVKGLKSSRKKRRRAVKEVVAAAPTGVGVPEIKAALSFLKTVGSLPAAKQALAAAG